MRPAQRLGELGLALETDPKRVRAELGKSKHLSADLEHRGLGAERKRLLGSGKREAVIAKLGGVHRPNVDYRSRWTSPASSSIRSPSRSTISAPVAVTPVAVPSQSRHLT